MAATDIRRELAHRASDGVSISLYWEAVADALVLTVLDERSGEYFELGVPRERGLDAFHHPYAYLAWAQAPGRVEPLAA